MQATRAQARDRVLRVAQTAPDLTWLLRQSAAAIGRAVPVEGWCGFTLDPATLTKATGVHGAQLAPALLGRLFELEYGRGDANLFADLARERRTAAILTNPDASRRFHEVLRPSGYGHELRLVLLDRDTAWGGFVFLREPGSRPFTPADSRFVAALGRHLARAVRRILLPAAPAGTGEPMPPGLLLLDERYRVASSTAGTEALLADLLGDGGGPGTLHTSVYAVAAKAAPGRAPASVRVPTRGGGWSTLHGWRLTGPARIAVSIERSRPEAVAALALDAYGLSARERQIVALLLAGLSTQDIAAKLYLSPHTVRDHVKTVFAKTGVRSRPALTAALRPI